MQADIQFLAFFLATTHFKNQNSHTITKTWSTPETPYPCRMLHCFTHSFWRSKNLQEKQWKGPGPQQPTSEHRGSQTCLAAAEKKRDKKRHECQGGKREVKLSILTPADQLVSPACSKADMNGSGRVEEEWSLFFKSQSLKLSDFWPFKIRWYPLWQLNRCKIKLSQAEGAGDIHPGEKTALEKHYWGFFVLEGHF